MPSLNRRTEQKKPDRNQFRSFYQSARWHKLSRDFRRANPLCKRCLDKGIVELGEVVDHVIRLELWVAQGGDPHDMTNLQTLSKKCHSIKTKEERKA